MIDIHMHVGKLYIDKELTVPYLFRFMDKNKIEKAALLPIESPEETYYYVTTNQIIDICRKNKKRFIPFCNIDPRRYNSDDKTDFYSVLKDYKERGCKGFGEFMCGLYIDDIRCQKIYEACGKLKLPIIFHMDSLRIIDNKGLPKMESMIRKFKETVFIGHGQHFWAEISSDVKKEEFSRYPKGPIKKGGAVLRLLKYKNCYADISAGSGYNALTRDIGFGYNILEIYQDKLLFGSDLCRVGQKVEVIDYLRKSLEQGNITKKVYEKISYKNAVKLFKL